MKSKNKRGRPRTHRKPVLVRFDRNTLKDIDYVMRKYQYSSRAETIRRMITMLSADMGLFS